MEFWNLAILVGAALLLVSIVASDISSRMGAPLLLVFLADLGNLVKQLRTALLDARPKKRK
jgi:NhaP-type Na+/H+ and K+/H+ antiporter